MYQPLMGAVSQSQHRGAAFPHSPGLWLNRAARGSMRHGSWSHLSPQQTPEAQEGAPQPLVRGQGHAAEGLPSKLHNDDLHKSCGYTMRMAGEEVRGPLY